MRIPGTFPALLCFLTCISIGCGANTNGMATPESELVINLVSQGLADQKNAARWISPTLGSAPTYRLMKLSSTRLIPPFQESDEPNLLKIQVVAAGEYAVGKSPLPTSPMSALRPPASEKEALEMKESDAGRTATQAVITDSDAIPFRASFTVYVAKDNQGQWSIR